MAELKKIVQNRNNRIMIIILIIGIIIIMISGAFSGEQKSAPSDDNEIWREEERLSGILSQIDGAGQVSVMISYDSTMEKDIAYENEHALTSGGDVVVRRELYPGVRGVIVIAEGAYDAAVKSAIKEAVAAVTGAGVNRICVYEMEMRK